MKQKIAGFYQEDESHWVAELVCGHRQHVRHDPPLISRPWVLTEAGRAEHLDRELDCKLCEPDPACDRPPPSGIRRSPSGVNDGPGDYQSQA